MEEYMKEVMIQSSELITVVESRNAPASGVAGLLLLSLVNDMQGPCCCCNCNCNCCCIC